MRRCAYRASSIITCIGQFCTIITCIKFFTVTLTILLVLLSTRFTSHRIIIMSRGDIAMGANRPRWYGGGGRDNFSTDARQHTAATILFYNSLVDANNNENPINLKTRVSYCRRGIKRLRAFNRARTPSDGGVYLMLKHTPSPYRI